MLSILLSEGALCPNYYRFSRIRLCLIHVSSHRLWKTRFVTAGRKGNTGRSAKEKTKHCTSSISEPRRARVLTEAHEHQQTEDGLTQQRPGGGPLRRRSL